jgi:3-deoxy-D-manno-octulosonic-acid transferase
MRKHQLFFKWYGSYFRESLKAFHHFFLQDKESAVLLESIGYNNCTVCGDTRFDRVIQIANEKIELPQIQQFKNDNLLIVCGSTWPVDEEYLLKIIAESPKNVKWIFAPHQIHHTEIQKLTQNPNINTVLFSANNTMESLRQAQLLVIDSIGLLSSIYAYADIAYVGGGFGKAVHNTAEPAVYGIPVIFGPKHKKFREAIDLIHHHGAFSVSDAETLKKRLFYLIENPHVRAEAGKKAKAYITQNAGGVEIIWKMTQVS